MVSLSFLPEFELVEAGTQKKRYRVIENPVLEAHIRRIWGRHGFDVGREPLGACRGTGYLVKPAVTLIVANDDNYAIAA